MKKQVNKTVKLVCVLTALAAMVIAAGCNNLLAPPASGAKAGAGKGLVTISIGDPAGRTLLPAVTDLLIDSWELTFTEAALGTVRAITNWDGTSPVALEEGTWSLALAAKNDGVEVATGASTADFTVAVDTTAAVAVTLVFSAPGAGTGSLEYAITNSSAFTPAVTIVLRSLGDGTETTIGTALSGTADSIPAGYYLVIATLSAGGTEAVKSDVAHIYADQVTKLAWEFAGEDFRMYIKGTLAKETADGGVLRGTLTIYEDAGKTIPINSVTLPMNSTSWRISIPSSYSGQTVHAQIVYKGYESTVEPVPVGATGAENVALALDAWDKEYSLSFDGNITNTKSHGGALTEEGTVGWESNARGDGKQAVRLTKDNYINLGRDFDYSESFTIAFWVKANTPFAPSDAAVFGNKRWDSGGGSLRGFVICMTGASLKVNIGNGSTNLGDVSLGNVTTGWAHVAVVFDKETGTNGQVRYYYNGNEVSTKNYNISGGMNGGFNSYIGQTAGNAADSGRINTNFNCQMQDFLLVNQTLSAMEIADLVDPVAPELVFVQGARARAINYSWTTANPGDNVTYELYIKEDTSIAADGSDGTLVATENGAITSRTVTGLTGGATYSAVLKISRGGKTAYSAVKQAVTKTALSANFDSAPILDPLVTGKAPGRVNYTWEAAEPEDGVTYELLYVKADLTTAAAITGASPTSVTLTTPGSAYFTGDYAEKYSVVVSATRNGETVYSNVEQATTTAQTIAYSLKFDNNLNNEPDAGYLAPTVSVTGTETYFDAPGGRKAIDLSYNNYIQLDTATDPFNYSQNFTVAFRVKVDSTKIKGSDPVIFSNKDWASGTANGFLLMVRDIDKTPAKGKGIILHSKSNSDSARLGGANDVTIAGGVDGNANSIKDTWVHIAVVYDKDGGTNGQVRYYANGAKVGERNTDLTGGISASKRSYLAQSVNGGGLYNTNNLGVAFQMQDFLLVNQTLTDEEIADRAFAAPELVFAAGTTSGTINYSWQGATFNTGVTYKLYYKDGSSIAPNGSDGILAATETGASSGTISGLTAGTTYSAVLEASTDGKTGYSWVKQATVAYGDATALIAEIAAATEALRRVGPGDVKPLNGLAAGTGGAYDANATNKAASNTGPAYGYLGSIANGVPGAITVISPAGDGSEVNPNKFWITAADKTAYQQAIDDAQAVVDEFTSPQGTIDAALGTLETAGTTFESAKTAGTKTLTAITGVTDGANIAPNRLYVTASGRHGNANLDASSVFTNTSGHRWATPGSWTDNAHWLTVEFGSIVRVDKAEILSFGSPNGATTGRITKFNIEYLEAGEWKIAYRYDGGQIAGSSTNAVGSYLTTCDFNAAVSGAIKEANGTIEASIIRLNIIAASADPSIWEFKLLYKAAP
ncbi:hypothetical protein AGMMS50267_15620 [Spirochaetia bacterium]|nr:hypothetical protein AGMMS50267_15620 [Spirochaetia bacterium]